jgi:hypothetical protein
MTATITYTGGLTLPTAETAAAAKRAGNGVRGPAIGYAGVEGVNAVAQRV